jgi:tRNA (mo5U34)-methyltransferase
MMGENETQIRERIASVPFWWHSIEVAPGLITPGHKTPELHAHELATLRFPDLRDKTVLDIGGWDGFYAFHAEELGAKRVAVLDEYVWAIDRKGLAERPPTTPEDAEAIRFHLEESEFFRPDLLPGKVGFDLARELRGSSVEAIAGDWMAMPLDAVGVWDVTLLLGVLYHLENPLGCLRRLAAVTGEQAIIETQAIAVGGRPDASLWEFYPADELNNDPTNWFVPTQVALRGALLSAGFARVEFLVSPPPVEPNQIAGYRAAAHAFK